MFVLSRRLSWLLLTFAFFFILAPAFLAPKVYAQDAGLDLKSVLPMAANGGVGIILLIVIIVITKREKQQSDEKMQLFTAQLKDQNETTKLAFEKYNESTQQLIALLKANQEQNMQIQKDGQETTSLLTGTLSRLEVNLARPLKCPLLDRRDTGSQGA